jgi:hypothetical protein
MSVYDEPLDFGRADYNKAFFGAPERPDDAEPVFLLRGKDPAAARAVRAWVSMAGDYGTDAEMLKAANLHAVRMEAYAAQAGRKVPDVPATG